MPAAEAEITPELVRRLIDRQHPDLAHLPVELLASGWDNVMVKLGDALIVRLPRREAAAGLVRNEQRWLPVLAPRLPLPVPAPIRIGQPDLDYPWEWSIVPLLPGQIAWRNLPADAEDAAVRLGGFLAALHAAAVPEAPVNPFRGIPLAGRAEADARNLAAVRDQVDHDAAMCVWQAALNAPRWAERPVWVHGDLHPANILVHDGQVSGVVDFGDITAGDPATDLAVMWMLLPAESHTTFRQAYGGADADLWTRARGWALVLSLAFLAHSADNPLIAAIGRHTLTTALFS
jgi:aminoglycoside phosphotransferase (APT) family kinase protein